MSSKQQKGKKLNGFEHCLLRPDMYIGTVLTQIKEIWVMDTDGNVFQKKMRFNSGLFNIIRELLSNAIDNVWRSQQLCPDNLVKKILLEINGNNIEIRNDGYCIPCHLSKYETKDPKSGIITTEEQYPAEVFFGDFRTGTNYDDDESRKTSGRNGSGAKISNCLSTWFQVHHSNPEDKAMFTQIYQNNGSTRTEPLIEKYSKKTGFTSVKFTPDYKYFKYPTEEEPGMDDNLINVLRLYAHEVAMITKVNVKFVVNDVVSNIKVPSLEKFSRLFYPSVSENKMITLTAASGDECVLVESVPLDIDESENITHLSYVNGVRTKDGGIHLEAWRDAIIGSIVKTFNARPIKKEIPKASARTVYPYLTLFVRTEVDRPQFDSQAKDELVEVRDEEGKPSTYKLFNSKSKTEKKEFTDQLTESLKKIMKWGFVGLLEDKLSSKVMNALSKKEGSDTRMPLGKKGRHANFANTKNADQAIFFVAEGGSARKLVEQGISTMDNGTDLFGSFEIKGKFINVKRHSTVKILKNEEVRILKGALNLKTGLDYSIDENFKTLYYQRGVAFAADQDSDGFHIRALLIEFLREFKGLIERGFIKSLSTAVAAIVWNPDTNKEKKKLFFSLPEFKSYIAEHGKPKGTELRYYKGLASIKNKDASLYFNPPRIITYFEDEDADAMMELGLGKGKENCIKRKNYITQDIDESFIEQPDRIANNIDESEFIFEGNLGIGHFTRTQLVLYHKEAVRRAIPCMWDGLKEGQRKILYALLLPKNNKNMDLEKAMGAIKCATNYHHGGVSIQGTIVGMTQRFVGSNNIPLLMDNGQCGTRSDRLAGAGRYVHTKVETITRIIFPKVDDNLLERVIEDNDEVEYKYYMPIIPMILINGAMGIGSGWATDVPCYNPLEIVNRLESIMDGIDIDTLPPLVPYYMGYTGEIKLNENKDAYISRGILQKSEKRKGEKDESWQIKELALNVKTDDFKEWLEYLQTGVIPKGKKWKKLNDKAIKDIKNNSKTNTVDFTIKTTKDFMPDIDTPSGIGSYMKATHTLKKMYLIDGNNFPHKFESPEQIIKAFYPKRLHFYQLRKEYLIRTFKDSVLTAQERYRFVQAVVDKKLDINIPKSQLDTLLSEEPWSFIKMASGKKKDTEEEEEEEEEIVSGKVQSKKVTHNYLLNMKIWSMTEEKLCVIKTESKKLTDELTALMNKTPIQLWKDDLEGFKLAYVDFLRDRTEVSVPKKRKQLK